MTKSPKVAVVIGNGGIKTLAALPILSFLEKENIPISFIIGSGGGATLAALYSSGYSIQDIPEMMKKLYHRKTLLDLDYKTLMNLSGLSRKKFSPNKGILKNEKLLQVYRSLFKDMKLENLNIHTAIQTTDLMQASGVLIEKGDVATAACASNATFPFFPAAEIEGKYLVDGVYSAALPLLTTSIRDFDVILAIALNQEYCITRSFGLIEYYCNFFNRIYSCGQTNHYPLGLMVITGELSLLTANFSPRVNLWNTHRIPEILSEGEKLLAYHKDEILQICKK